MVQSLGPALPTRIDQSVTAPPAVVSSGTTADASAPTNTDTQAQQAQQATVAADQTAAAQSAATRVVVEPGANKLVLVFKVLDSATGDVLAEIPNQTPQQAAKNPNYKTGSLVNQKI